MLAAILCTRNPAPPAADTGGTFYGPALTRAERARWFGGMCDDPIARAAKRAAMEKLQRQAFGILPADAVEAMVEEAVCDKVEALPVAPLAGRAKVDINRIAERIAREIAPAIRAEIRAADELDEEEDAMNIFLLH